MAPRPHEQRLEQAEWKTYPQCVLNIPEVLPVRPTQMEVHIATIVGEIWDFVTCICEESKLANCLLRGR